MICKICNPNLTGVGDGYCGQHSTSGTAYKIGKESNGKQIHWYSGIENIIIMNTNLELGEEFEEGVYYRPAKDFLDNKFLADRGLLNAVARIKITY